MNKEMIKELFDEISTRTGLSYSGDRTLSKSEAESILDYISELEEKEPIYINMETRIDGAKIKEYFDKKNEDV